MSAATPFKRRRLNDAAATLKKPFVSPMRSSAKQEQKTPLQPTLRHPDIPYAPSTLAHSFTPAPNQQNTISDKSEARTGQHDTTPPYPRSQTTTLSTKFARHSARKDPAERELSRLITHLELEAKRLCNDIDILAQAEKLRTGNTDADLEELRQKWKKAAQDASEEVFGSVKERVNRMGGVRVWRQSEQRKFERANGLGEFAPEPEEDGNIDKDCEFDSQGEELPEAEQEYRKTEKKRMQQELMDATDVDERQGLEEKGPPRVWQEAGQDDDEFTMDMMLRSLNIELDVIGYDKQAQRWIS
ncbi:hypothetical protein K431DRAFT_247335 [Polychaeton citri CBS 116435]|uniref:DNA repair protein Dds20/Mei5 n=1 Tax=Polychaeton citri CBS 116435 TaxID=1314669 RepID=A0A9P4UQC0_9PEZI|nr:hypothetical protein K431DRAFT_247335 [Polychaeton citri CBS 116435]